MKPSLIDYLYLCRNVYHENSSQDLSEHVFDISTLHYYYCNKTTTAFTSIQTADHKKLIITFRGSHTLCDWLGDFAGKTKIIWFPSEETAEIHDGWLKKFKSARSIIESLIDTIGPEQVMFLGHSSGGCVAHIASLWFNCISDVPNVSVLSVGSPNFCNKVVAEYIHENINNFEIINQEDLIQDVKLSRAYTSLIPKNNQIIVNVALKKPTVFTYLFFGVSYAHYHFVQNYVASIKQFYENVNVLENTKIT